MTVNEALTYIHSVSWKGSIPGLSRTQELLERIGNPQNRLKFVHACAGGRGHGGIPHRLLYRHPVYHGV